MLTQLLTQLLTQFFAQFLPNSHAEGSMRAGFSTLVTLLFLSSLSANTLIAKDVEADKPNHWSPSERSRILSLGPWPSPGTALDSPQRRQVNPLAGNPQAIALGEFLFNDKRLSANGKVSCETCHQARLGFTDGLATSMGLSEGTRNSLPLFDLAEQRWLGWDGGADTLWAASIRPLLDPIEMGGKPAAIAQVLESDSKYASYLSAVKALVPAKGTSAAERDEHVLVIAAMSLAAWMETIESERTSFDRYRDALANAALAQGLSTERVTKGPDRPSELSEAFKGSGFTKEAERGLSIFIGKGNCWVCHGGPRFTHGEFHDIGRPFMIKRKEAKQSSARATSVDPGRYRGIERVKKDPYNLLGRWSPDPKSERAQLVDQAILQHRNWGEWKIPSLRNLRLTAPYMHDGSLTSLREVVLHYSELNEERLHADGEALLKPLKLSKQEVSDLVTFLESLSP